MKRPLYIGPDHNFRVIQISDATGRVIATMDYQFLAVATRWVNRENGWWFTLFGSLRRDEKQRQYDAWIRRRNFYHNHKVKTIKIRDVKC